MDVQYFIYEILDVVAGVNGGCGCYRSAEN